MSYNDQAQPFSLITETGEEVRFHRFCIAGTSEGTCKESGASDNPVGVSLPDSRYPDEKYEEETPVPLVGTGRTAKVIVMKTVAAGTPETWNEGDNLKLATQGRTYGESTGTRTATSVARLLERVTFASAAAADTESDPVLALIY